MVHHHGLNDRLLDDRLLEEYDPLRLPGFLRLVSRIGHHQEDDREEAAANASGDVTREDAHRPESEQNAAGPTESDSVITMCQGLPSKVKSESISALWTGLPVGLNRGAT